MRQPNDVVERWRTKAAIAVNGSERIALSFQGALFDPDIGPLTRVRLQRQLAGEDPRARHQVAPQAVAIGVGQDTAALFRDLVIRPREAFWPVAPREESGD